MWAGIHSYGKMATSLEWEGAFAKVRRLKDETRENYIVRVAQYINNKKIEVDLSEAKDEGIY